MTRAHVAGMVVVWALSVTAVWAQDAKQPGLNFVRLTNTFGTTSEELSVPLYVSTDPGTAVLSIIFTVELPPEFLKFLRIDPGFLAENAGVRFKTQPSESGVQVEIQASARNGKGVPSGLVGYLMLQALKDVPEATKFDVPIRRVSMATLAGQTLETSVLPDPAIVTIIPAGGPPLIACFFYMH